MDFLGDEVKNSWMSYLGDILKGYGGGISLSLGKVMGKIKVGDVIDEAGKNIGTFLWSEGNALSRFSKYGKCLKASGKVLGIAGIGLGFYDDINNNHKTVGEAITHQGANLIVGIGGAAFVESLAAGSSFAILASNPVGWGIAAGIVIGMGVDLAYNYNLLGFKDELNNMGKKLDSVGEAIKGNFSNVIKNLRW